MKLLANDNFPIASVLLLRALGYDIAAIGEDYPGVTDRFVMDVAQADQRTIITFDRDYGELIYKYNYKPDKGVIYLRLSEYTPGEPGKIVHQLLQIEGFKPDNLFTVFDGLSIRQRKY